MADFTDAFTLIQTQLQEWGLGSLGTAVLGYLQGGDSPTVALAKLRETNEYKTRFKANELRRQKGLAALTEAEYISNEMQYRRLMQSYGLPQGFYDSQEDFQNFLANDVSPQELRDRVVDAAERFVFAAPEEKAQFSRFGLTPGQAIATILDPERATPLIKQTITAIGLAAEAARAFNDSERLSTDRAMELSKIGVTEAEARRGFGDLAGRQANDLALSSRQGVNVTQRDLEDEALLGRRNANLERARNQERADFQASYVGTQSGLTRGNARNY